MISIGQYRSGTVSKVRFLLLVSSILAILAGIFSSCSEDDTTIDTNLSNVKVQFYANNLSFLKQTSEESQITEIQTLIFIDNGDGYKYSYSVPATSLNAVDSLTTSFDITLYTVTNPVKIYIIANSDNAISNNTPLVGETEAQVKQKIIQSFSSTGISANFPMWCEYLLPSGISSSLNNNIVQLKILRAIARVDISVADVESSFSMTSIQAFRVNSQLQITPNAYSNPLLVSEPSIPSTSTTTINTNPIIIANNTSESQLYLPESAAPSVANQTSDATCVVVGGRYNNSDDITYYRLDFAPDIAGYPLGQILRNHHYTFNVIDITAAGWPTPEEAARNRSTNIQAAIQDWEDVGANVGLGGNTYYFQISTREITIPSIATPNASGFSLVATNVPIYTIRWSDAAGNPLGEPADVLNDGVIRVLKTRNLIAVNAVANNPSPSTVLRYVLIEADRVRILLKIYHLGT